MAGAAAAGAAAAAAVVAVAAGTRVVPLRLFSGRPAGTDSTQALRRVAAV